MFRHLTIELSDSINSRADLRRVIEDCGMSFANVDSECFPYETNGYYAMLALEHYGDSTRDNSFSELVSLGFSLYKAG